ncbi:hypothetical protein Q4485_09675, partial [Granulosicoccaceae sp. 1_MG-2023]|nr:hypothetical protein [Granulosicoccaceae sp. 1_MG-2023]
ADTASAGRQGLSLSLSILLFAASGGGVVSAVCSEAQPQPGALPLAVDCVCLYHMQNNAYEARRRHNDKET